MGEKKVVQTIFYDVLDHVMAPVFCQENGKGSEITVGQRLFVYMVQYFDGRYLETIFKTGLQVFIKCMVQVILDHFFAKIGAAALIAEAPRRGALPAPLQDAPAQADNASQAT